MFSCFNGREEKEKYFTNASGMTTAAFASIGMAILYRLNALSEATASAVTLRVTPQVLAGVFDGSIVYWNDTMLQQANWEHMALLPYKRIKVSELGQFTLYCLYHSLLSL